MDAYIVVTVLLLLFAQLINSALEDSVFPVYVRKRAQGKEQASALIVLQP